MKNTDTTRNLHVDAFIFCPSLAFLSLLGRLLRRALSWAGWGLNRVAVGPKNGSGALTSGMVHADNLVGGGWVPWLFWFGFRLFFFSRCGLRLFMVYVAVNSNWHLSYCRPKSRCMSFHKYQQRPCRVEQAAGTTPSTPPRPVALRIRTARRALWVRRRLSSHLTLARFCPLHLTHIQSLDVWLCRRCSFRPIVFKSAKFEP